MDLLQQLLIEYKQTTEEYKQAREENKQAREEQRQIRENTAKQLEEIKIGQVNLKEDLLKGIDLAIVEFNQPNGFVEPMLFEGIDKENKETSDKEEEVKPCEEKYGAD